MSLQSVPLKTVIMYHADVTNETLPLSYEYCDGRTLGIGTHDIGGGSSAYTLPDLRNRFILGADITKGASITGGTTNSAADAPGPKGAGGVHAKTLATSELPAHTHTATTNTAGAHTHTGSSADSGGAHAHTASASTAGAHVHAGSSTSTAGSHSHSINDPGHGHAWYGDRGSGSHSALSQGGLTYLGPGDAGEIVASVTSISLNANGSHSHTLSMTTDGDHSHTITVNSGGTHTHSLTLVSDGGHTHTFTSDATGGGTSFDTRPRYYGLIFCMKVRN